MNHILRESSGVGLGEEMAEDLTLQFDEIFDDDLEASIVEDKRTLDALHARIVLKAAELDRREVVDRSDVGCGTVWEPEP